MQLRDAIQEFILECKVRRLVPRTIDNYGKHLRYLTNDLAEECQLEKLEDIKLAYIKKFLLMKEEQGCMVCCSFILTQVYGFTFSPNSLSISSMA